MTADPLDLLQQAVEGPTVRKAYRGGSHRTVDPADTIERVRARMSDMGITRIADVTGLDRIGIPVVMVCRPNSRSVAVSQGKGLTRDAAIASGLMESVETYHAEHIRLPLLEASFSDLLQESEIIDVDGLPSVAGSRFRDDLEIEWLWGHDLVGGGRIPLPYEVVRANFTLPRPPGSGCFDASTNGLASGNHLLEAVCHGICEVVERDATTLWNRLDRAHRRATGLDADTIDDAACREALDRLDESGFAVALWETTSNVGVPSFFAVILDTRVDEAHIGIGAGCHPEPGIALLRAITEAVQVRTTYISGTRDDISPAEYETAELTRRRNWVRGLMAGHRPVRAFRDTPGLAASTFNEDLRWLLDCLEAAGIHQVVSVNLTHDDIGIPVVRTVIPGLEGLDDHEDYVPGRRARWLEQRP